MFSEILNGLLTLANPIVLLYLIGGVLFGVVVGIIPGLGGMVVLVLLLPLTYSLDPSLALILLVAAHAVACTGGSVTAVLMGIPGTELNAATLIDGFPMTQLGRAGKALGIALAGSAAGGVFGAVVLAALLPVVRSVVMAFGAPETLALAFMGISFIAILGGASPMKGLIAGLLGLLVSMIGYSPLNSVPRYTFGSVYLYDGLPLIPMALGLFGVPPIFELMSTGSTLSKTVGVASATGADVWEGVLYVFRRWWLSLRSSVIGTVIGIIPGVGGGTAIWLAYGHAKVTSKTPEKFGHGAEEGVLGPEAANNSKEGGALLTSLAFGIPGSSSMALLLGALMIHGMPVGPQFLKDNMDLAFALVGTLVLANVIAAGGLLLLGKYLTGICSVPGHIVGPFVLMLMSLGAFSVNGNVLDVFMIYIVGIVGIVMTKLDYSRAALLVGFVLGALAERYLMLSTELYGASFITRPIVLSVIIVIILGLTYPRISSLARSIFRSRGTV